MSLRFEHSDHKPASGPSDLLIRQFEALLILLGTPIYTVSGLLARLRTLLLTLLRHPV